MDKHPSIDDLFAKARQQAPVASLAETKAAFMKAVGVPAVKSNLFTLKKWLMYTSVLAIVSLVTTAVFQLNTTKKQPGNSNTDSKLHAVNIPDNATQKEPSFVEERPVKQSIIKSNTDTHFPEEFFELLEKPAEVAQNWKKAYSSYGKDTLVQSDPYIFPVLTAEEISATEKQKKSMLKAIQKRINNREKYAYLPMGSFQYGEKYISVQAFFMQQTEVSNLEYRTFLFDLLIQGRKEDFLKAKPDQNMWVKQFDKGLQPMVDHYFSHAAYNDYPVVNISREGAELYCKWLTQSFNEYATKKKIPLINDMRLPSRTEWTYAASSGGKYTIYPWEGQFVRDSKGLFLANHKPFEGRFYDDGAFHTAKVNSYNPNEYGLYCLSGNVAEMVYDTDNSRSNPGTAGGDWTSDPEHIKLYAEDLYSGITEARCTVGFRVVFTFLEHH